MKVCRKEVTISATNDTAGSNATVVNTLQGAYTPITPVQKCRQQCHSSEYAPGSLYTNHTSEDRPRVRPKAAWEDMTEAPDLPHA